MKLLHVLSQVEVTGAEVYACELARRQVEQGHDVFIVSDTLTIPHPAKYIPFPIGNRRYPNRARAILFLVRLVRQERIDVIHTHSRAASWVSHFVSLFTDVPMVSTVHGRQHLHASLRLFNVYGRRTIAVNESLRTHLVNEVGLPRSQVIIIPNGIMLDPERVPPVTKAQLYGRPETEPILLFVGRLTGPKGDVVRFLVREVMPALLCRESMSLVIVGGQIVPEDIPDLVRTANRSIGREAIVLHGFSRGLRPFFFTADVVIGSGRVVMEAMLDGTPVLAFGESGYVGAITPENVESAAESNFGDTGLRRPPSVDRVVEELLGMVQRGRQTANLSQLQQYVRCHFDVREVETRVAALYRQARAETRPAPNMPVLMYHRVVESAPTGSAHGIWVTVDRFAAQMQSLHDRRYTPITFREYLDYLDGSRPLPPKPILLTFDDGYADNYTTAFPVLQKFRFSAVIFLVADFSRRTNFWDTAEPVTPLLSIEQIREMDRAGIEFGSHTMSHPHLTQLDRDKVRDEFRRSKSLLEDVLGRPVHSLCYPYGELNRVVKEELFSAAYEFGVAGDSGPTIFGRDLGEIRRRQVFPGTDRFGFWKKTTAWYAHYRRVTGR